jgi:glycosyltransferase involved in cell wall biosynthesis
LVLFINPLKERHGSTYRARNLSRLLARKTRLSYIEPDDRGGGDSAGHNGEGYFQLLRMAVNHMRACAGSEFDLLYLQKPMVLTWPCLVLAKLTGRKAVIDFDDIDSLWQTSRLKGRLAGLGERFMPRWADALTTHNEYLRQYIRRFCTKQIFVVPQGVETALFDPKRFEKTREKERLGLADKTVFCFLGSFTKGSAADLDLILHAFRKVASAREDASLMMVGGGGPLEDHYMALLRELGLTNRIVITGRVKQEEVPRYLSCADYGLICMRDNLANKCRVSLKLIEYLSMELTVIGHVVGDSSDVFGSYCFLCEPDARSLGRRMIDVMGSQSRKGSARPFIVKNYDWEKLMPSLAAVLEYCQVAGS